MSTKLYFNLLALWCVSSESANEMLVAGLMLRALPCMLRRASLPYDPASATTPDPSCALISALPQGM
jgi:hypothetical protein